MIERGELRLPEVPVWYGPAAKDHKFTVVIRGGEKAVVDALDEIDRNADLAGEMQAGRWAVRGETRWPDGTTIYGPDGLLLEWIEQDIGDGGFLLPAVRSAKVRFFARRRRI